MVGQQEVQRHLQRGLRLLVVCSMHGMAGGAVFQLGGEQLGGRRLLVFSSQVDVESSWTAGF